MTIHPSCDVQITYLPTVCVYGVLFQGEVINVPYELTVSPAIRDFWQAAFYSHDRLNTSTPFARKVR